MKKLVKIVLVLVGIVLIISVGYTFYLSRGLDSVDSIEMTDVNLSTLSDGIYTGHYSEGRWRNTVEVTISNGKITAIKPLQTVVFEKEDVTKEIFKRVIDEQKITVDTVSGSTVTSKAYLKSIENALQQKK